MASQSVLIHRDLIEKGLQLMHEVLMEKRDISEDLRLRLVDWRTDVEWALEQIDNTSPE